MKVFILTALLFFSQIVERRCAEQFYTTTRNISYYFQVTGVAKNKPCILKKVDPYLSKIDSTIHELEDIQRRHQCIENRCATVCRSAGQYYPLVNCLKLFSTQSVEDDNQKTSYDRRRLGSSEDCGRKILKWIYKQVKRRVLVVVTELYKPPLIQTVFR